MSVPIQASPASTRRTSAATNGRNAAASVPTANSTALAVITALSENRWRASGSSEDPDDRPDAERAEQEPVAGGVEVQPSRR